MNIVMVAYHSCVRGQKMAMALKDKGHNVHLIASNAPYHAKYYKTFTLVHDLDQTIEAIKISSQFADVFHVHTEPNWYVTVIKENTNTPVIIDIHDSFLSRLTDREVDRIRAKGEEAFRITAEERNNYQLADGIVFPSQTYEKLIKKEFGLNQPFLTLPSYCYRKDYQYTCAEWVGGLVYQGRLDLKTEIKKVVHLKGFTYCDYEEMAQKLSEENIAFHLYPLRQDKEFIDIYKDISIIHAGKDYGDLLKCLTRHDWGLVGNIFPTSQWTAALPNKLFEYIAACVPIVVINAKESGIFVRKHNIGIEVKSIQEFKERWPEHEEIRKNLIKTRLKFTMDAHIHKLEDLYEKII